MEQDIPLKTLILKSLHGYMNIRQSRYWNRKIARDKEGIYILIKEPVHQKDLTILNMYAPTSAVITLLPLPMLVICAFFFLINLVRILAMF